MSPSLPHESCDMYSPSLFLTLRYYSITHSVIMNLNTVKPEKSIDTKPANMLHLIAPSIHILPPSDFKDLLLELIYLEASLIVFQHQTSPLRATYHVQKDAVTLRDLKAQIQKIDTHYGWVLATDSAAVSGRFSTMREEEAKTWLGAICARYNEICTTLNEPS
jgi:hypothetical protein